MSIAYKYDDTGFRTQKTVNGTTTDYLVLENRILQQSDGTNTITFRYDGENKAASFDLNGTEYYYLRNLQGDIAGIVDGTGSLVVEYTYDAWGKLLSITGSLADTVGVLNPLRYRGYYYDTETGLYYLQSRYYNPEWGRFINADDVALLSMNNIILSCNLFSYCVNNPIMMVDTTGYWARAVIAGVSGAVFGGIAYAIGRAFGMSRWRLVGFTAAFVGVGIVIGLVWGPQILYRINALIKPVIYFFSNPGKVYFGLKLLSKIQFELHNPHHGKSVHFVIRILQNGRWKQAFEWILKK